MYALKHSSCVHTQKHYKFGSISEKQTFANQGIGYQIATTNKLHDKDDLANEFETLTQFIILEYLPCGMNNIIWGLFNYLPGGTFALLRIAIDIPKVPIHSLKCKSLLCISSCLLGLGTMRSMHLYNPSFTSPFASNSFV